MINHKSSLILIIDFGSQYTQLIARRVRDSGVYSIVESNDVSVEQIIKINPNGIILSGGPESVGSKKKINLTKKIFNLNIPILGICYGMQFIAHHFKGKVNTSNKREFGHSNFIIQGKSKLFSSIGKTKNLNVWMSHSDKVIKLPKNFLTIG